MIATKKYKIITRQQKALLLKESFRAGRIITELAKAYGISPHTIYGWRTKHKHKEPSEKKELSQVGYTISAKKELSQVSEATSVNTNNFVEVAIISSKPLVLQKANLVFDDAVLSIEGKINSTKLLEIVKILEASC